MVTKEPRIRSHYSAKGAKSCAKGKTNKKGGGLDRETKKSRKYLRGAGGPGGGNVKELRTEEEPHN